MTADEVKRARAAGCWPFPELSPGPGEAEVPAPPIERPPRPPKPAHADLPAAPF
jgi:hypothetical protein